MLKRFVSICVLVCSLTVILSGCSLLDFFSADNLLKAPKLTGESSALQKTFEDTVGMEVSLFTPIAGDNRASYIFFDANGDGKDEALVFYAVNANISVVHMHLLSRNSESWYSVADIIGSGTGVYKVDFFNLDNDTNLEIAVSWTADDSQKEKKLSIYDISGLGENSENSISSIATIQMADYICFDIDDDETDELLYFYFGIENMNSVFGSRVLDYAEDEETLLPLSDVSSDTAVSSILDISVNGYENGYGIFVDALLSDGRYITEIIFYDSSLSVLSLPEADGIRLSEKTVRSFSEQCADIDDDGIIDIPLELKSEKSYNIGSAANSQSEVRFVEWVTFSDGILKENGKYFDNPSDGFCLKLDSVYESYYLVYDYVNSVTQMRIDEDDEENNIVFTVEIKEKSDSLLSDNSRYEINVTPKGDAFGFTEESIEELILNRKG